MARNSEFFELLRVLVRHEVDFIVVGGVAAVLHGAPIMTSDLDVLFDSKPDNTAHMLVALEEVKANYMDPAGRHIEPSVEKLETFEINLLYTEYGRLDVLRTIGAGKIYGDLISQSDEYEVEDLRLRVLGLQAIIDSKEIADRPKDRQALPFLRELLDMRDGGSDDLS